MSLFPAAFEELSFPSANEKVWARQFFDPSLRCLDEATGPILGPRPMEHNLVLVVDDDFEIREIVKDILADEGYLVATAQDGATALTFLGEKTPGAILLDLMMPGMDGFEFRRRQLTEEELADIPTIVMTASGRAGEVPRGRGPLFSIEKPFRAALLVETVRHAMQPTAPT